MMPCVSLQIGYPFSGTRYLLSLTPYRHVKLSHKRFLPHSNSVLNLAMKSHLTNQIMNMTIKYEGLFLTLVTHKIQLFLDVTVS
jgi:hypothetical protein